MNEAELKHWSSFYPRCPKGNHLAESRGFWLLFDDTKSNIKKKIE